MSFFPSADRQSENARKREREQDETIHYERVVRSTAIDWHWGENESKEERKKK